MNTIHKIKRKIYMVLREKSFFSPLTKILNFFNIFIFHCKDMEKRKSYGKQDPDKKYYVIRPGTNMEGLLSLYFRVVKHVRWAEENGYIPYVDFKSSKCQYYTGRKIHGTTNAWEYYFSQPAGISDKEIKQKRNVLLSGLNSKASKIPSQINMTALSDPQTRKIVQELRVRKYIKELAKPIQVSEFSGYQVLGVFIRGTDYVALKPKGHPIQPTIDMVVNKVKEFIEKYSIDRIFVVTEEFDYYKRIIDEFGDMVFSSDDSFIKDYHDDGYISDYLKSDSYECGLNYLIRLILLSECDYLVSGITNGSLFSMMIKEKPWLDSYCFDLGLYP